MRQLLPALLLGGVLLASGCGSDAPSVEPPSGPRALTADEADRLAVVRLDNYKRDLAPFELVVPVGDQVLTIDGQVDFRDHRAIGALVTDDAPPSYGVVAWNLRSAGLLTTAEAVAPDQLADLPAEGWHVHALVPTDDLDATLLVLLNRALDRPENAQLLRQNGAQWRGATTFAGTDVDLMSATPEGQGQAITYYVDARGGLVRADLELADSARPATITFPAGDGAEVPVVKALGRAPAS
ncbi:hypothetical protein BH11ACT8_BH11ACT8_28100 [soil metagenome]